jgi:hypothetical protein
MYGACKGDYFLFFSNSQGVVLGAWFTLSCIPLLDAKARNTHAFRFPLFARPRAAALTRAPLPGATPAGSRDA